MSIRAILVLAVSPLAIAAQEAAKADPKADSKPAAKIYLVELGTKVPLSVINSVSTKSAQPGDRVYLESVFPILVDGRIVIPPGSYVAGTITKIQRPGKVKGRGNSIFASTR
jgi:type IV secretion system protein VirB10